MSCTILYYITPSGRIYEAAEFRNSHRSASMVWSNLYKRYLPERIELVKQTMHFTPENPVTDDDYNAIWKLWKRQDIPIYVRAVLFSTFDYAFLAKENFQRFYDDVLKYAGLFAAGSLICQAQEIVKLQKKKIVGVCWQQTSVSDNLWNRKFFSIENRVNIYEEIDKFVNNEVIS